ncbi:hypothetical protein PM082_004184 [Marasmius tenuissimus]|nr:hypothetical protein PM082_004184 [Marasmius tenuissimus]
MTKGLFDEWLRKFDLQMNQDDHHIGLSLDNFSGHYPCDAGIIQCVKARYCTLLSLCALDWEEASEEDLFKIDVLLAMRLLQKAWDDVTPETIQNCWRHSGVLPGDDKEWEDIFVDSDAPDIDSDIEMDGPPDEKSVKSGWDILMEYATSDLTHRDAEKKLKELLGNTYNPADWESALFAVMESESTEAAVAAVRAQMPKGKSASQTTQTSRCTAQPTQLVELETEVMECVGELYKRRHLRNMPTLDEVVDPSTEYEVLQLREGYIISFIYDILSMKPIRLFI